MNLYEQIQASIEHQMKLPVDQLIDLRRRQAAALRAYNEAHAAWVADCGKRRWWQRKPPPPACEPVWF